MGENDRSCSCGEGSFRRSAGVASEEVAIRPFWFGRVSVVDNRPVAEEIYLLRFRAPEIARRILPGQFLMVRLPETVDPLLGRAFALYDTASDNRGEPSLVEIVYEVVGKMTRRLARLTAGAELEVWGPLGNSFPAEHTEHWILVAGGIGITPFLAFAKEVRGAKQYGQAPRAVPACSRITLCYGARTKARLACVDDFRHLGVDVIICTDDGSAGRQGVVSDVLIDVLVAAGIRSAKGFVDKEHAMASQKAGGGAVPAAPPAVRVVACGPDAMLRKTAEICLACGIPCWVSLESPMACGMGICFSCAVPVRTGEDTWDYRRACVDGPVFRAEAIAWEVLSSAGE